MASVGLGIVDCGHRGPQMAVNMARMEGLRWRPHWQSSGPKRPARQCTFPSSRNQDREHLVSRLSSSYSVFLYGVRDDLRSVIR